MIPLSNERRGRLLGIHGWFGVVLGLLVYVVVVTGTVAVITPEIEDWSSPLGTSASADLLPGLDGPLKELAKEVDPAFHEEVSAFRHAGGRVTVFFHTHGVRPDTGSVETTGVEFDLDPYSYAVLERREGWISDISSHDRSTALADYLAELHASLHIAPPFGVLVVGLAGFALLIAAVTGLLVHRHLLKELFTRRGRERPRLARRDAHTVAASWMLPFALMFGFTGVYFGYYGTVGPAAVAEVATGGSRAAMSQAKVALPPRNDTGPAPIADMDVIMLDARQRSGVEPRFLIVDNWGQRNALVKVFTALQPGDVFGLNYVYDGSSGDFLFEKPSYGMVVSAGGALGDMVDWVHFGRFGGTLADAAWFGLGLLLAYASLSGILLWCSRREENNRAWHKLTRLAHGVGYGLPLSLALLPYGFFPPRAAGAAVMDSTMTAAFCTGVALAAIATFALRDTHSIRRLLMGLTGIALIGLPLLRILTGGPGWGTALEARLFTVLVLDAAALLGGGAHLLLAAQRTKPGGSRSAGQERGAAAAAAGSQ